MKDLKTQGGVEEGNPCRDGRANTKTANELVRGIGC